MFTHLHVHTEYSIDGISKIEELFSRAKQLEMPALAITDHGTISGIPEFFSTSKKYPMVKPIAGCEFWVKAFNKPMHLILLAKNLTGYRHLLKLSTLSFANKYCGRPCLSHWQIDKYHKGLICLSACIGGEIPQRILTNDFEGAQRIAEWYKLVFGEDFYLEVSSHKNFGTIKLDSYDNRVAYRKSNHRLTALQKRSNDGIFELAKVLDIKVVATNDVHFVNREDAIAQDLKMCLMYNKEVDDPDRFRYSHLEYLKSDKEMQLLFPEHLEVIENTQEIVEKVERYEIETIPKLPAVSKEDPYASLRKMVMKGAKKRYGSVDKNIKKRIESELNMIHASGYSSYFLIMKDLVDWIKSQGWLLGTGRGSAASSVVNYCLGITEVNPLEYNLLFERFMNQDKILPFDIALDVNATAHLKISEYLKEKYGKDMVANIIVFDSFRGERDMSKYREKLVNVMNGREREHLNGILLSHSDIKKFVPVEKLPMPDQSYTLCSRYETKWAEYVGLVKFNFIWLRVLDYMENIVRLVRNNTHNELDLNKIPLDDKETLSLYCHGKTMEIFQFESVTAQTWLRMLKPDSFSDLMALNALYRPGLIKQIPSYLENKNNQDKIKYDLPEIKDVLSETYGILVYQEQIMELSQKLAGFSPEDSNRLRRAIVKKSIPMMLCFKERFLSAGHKNGYSVKALKNLWELFTEIGPFTINKSHIVSYTLMSFRMMWLKAHYPKEFYTIILNTELMEFDHVQDAFIKECESQGFTVIPPDKSENGIFVIEKQ